MTKDCILCLQVNFWLFGSFFFFTSMVLLSEDNHNWTWTGFIALVLFIVACVSSFGSGSDDVWVKCGLCNQYTPVSDVKEHKITCAEENKESLESLPKSTSVKCPDCASLLTLWPKNMEPKSFSCSSNRCSIDVGEGAKASIVNNGQNCYCCFICDYYLCSMCEQLQDSVNCDLQNAENETSLLPVIEHDGQQQLHPRRGRRGRHYHPQRRHDGTFCDVAAVFDSDSDPPPSYESVIVNIPEEPKMSERLAENV